MRYIKNLIKEEIQNLQFEAEVRKFGDVFSKNAWVSLSRQNVKDYADEIVELIKIAYANKGGNFELNTGDDLRKSDLKFWIANDVDEDPDPDVAVGGKSTPAGTKITAVGQDGSPEARKATVQKLIATMKTRGFYAELDPDLAEKLKLDTITDESVVKKVLAGKEISNFNASTGLYTRNVSGAKDVEKVLVGIPTIKEYVIARSKIDDAIVLAKNRDRGYKAKVERANLKGAKMDKNLQENKKSDVDLLREFIKKEVNIAVAKLKKK